MFSVRKTIDAPNKYAADFLPSVFETRKKPRCEKNQLYA